MGTPGKVAAILLTLILVVSLGGANAAMALDRTVLDDEFVIETFEQEEVYTDLTDEFQDQAANDLGTGSGPGEELPPGITAEEVDTGTVVEETVTRDYVKQEVDRNIRNIYAFLHGETDRLNLTIDLTPLKENLGETVGEDIIEVDSAELIAQGDAIDIGGISLSSDQIASMQESPEQYSEVRTDVWVQITYETSDPETLLPLIGEDPRDYTEQERQQIVEDREQEIKSELRDDLQTYEDLPDPAREELAQYNTELKESVEQDTRNAAEGDELPDEAVDGLVGIQTTVVDGLTSGMTYEEYTTQLSSNEQQVEEAMGTFFQQQLDEEIPDEQALDEGIDQEASQQLDTAATQVQRIGMLAWGLTILSLLLVVAIGVATRSLGWWSSATGVAFLFVGLVGTVVSFGLRGTILGFLEEQMASPEQQNEVAASLFDAMFGLVGRSIGTFGRQSLLLLFIGIGLVGIALANRAGMLDPVKEELGLGDDGDGSADEQAATTGDGTPVDEGGVADDPIPADGTGDDDPGAGVDDEPGAGIGDDSAAGAEPAGEAGSEGATGDSPDEK